MRDALLKDYKAMAGMVYGPVPSFDTVLASVEKLEMNANGVASG